MSDMLSVAASGLRAYQTALGAVSNNIANAATPGYSRRQVDMSEISSTDGGITQARSMANGVGVVVLGITRSADAQKAENVRSTGADLARSEASIQWLQSIDTSLSGNGLSDALTGFFTSAKSVAADPSASAPRSAMLEAATTVANAFAATGNALTAAESNLDDSADAAVSTLNGLGKSLAAVNAGLGRAAPGSDNAATLQDQRDDLLEKMSAISDVSVSFDDVGRATVNLGGTGGPTFVTADSAGTVTYARNDSGAVSFVMYRSGASAIVTPAGGALGGMVDGAAQLAAARSSLDTLASSFVDGINNFQAQGRDLDGNAGQPMFATGASPTDISLSLTDPRGIAAAGVGGGPRDNGNLATLDALRSSADYEGRLTSLISGNAATLAARNTVASAQNAMHDGAVSARDSVSGVNLDDEAVDLMRFQQAYQASSRVIQVARDTFQSIIQIS